MTHTLFEHTILNENIRYAVLTGKNSFKAQIKNFINVISNTFKGFTIENVIICRSLKDAIKQCPTNGMVIKFVVNEEDFVEYILARCEPNTNFTAIKVVDVEVSEVFLEDLNNHYQNYIEQKPDDKPMAYDSPVNEPNYQYARLSDLSYGGSYEDYSLISAHCPDSCACIYLISCGLPLLASIPMKVAFVSNFIWHHLCDPQLFGHTLEHEITLFKENMHDYSGTWVQFSLDDNGDFLKITAGYRVTHDFFDKNDDNCQIEELEFNPVDIKASVTNKFKEQYLQALQTVKDIEMIKQQNNQQKMNHQAYIQKRRSEKLTRDGRASGSLNL